jgi:pimeloyl-ACP methyl ester carboxylesterase
MKAITLKNGNVISYRASDTLDSPFVFLAPGPSDSSYFSRYINDYLENVNYLIPDYPGRGKSSCQKDNSVQGVARSLDSLFDALNVNNITLIGFSYGTQVSVELLKINPSRYKEVHLAAVGQFYKLGKRFLFKLPFYLPMVFPKLQNIFRSLLIRFNIFGEDFPQKNLGAICDQWLNTLNYKYDLPQKYSVPITLYIYLNDQIVDSDSLIALRDSFINLKEVKLKGSHPGTLEEYSEFERSYLEGILH